MEQAALVVGRRVRYAEITLESITELPTEISQIAEPIERDRVIPQVLLALLLTALLRIPSFSWPTISDDEGIYDAMAKVVNAGGVMYRDAVDHKPPGLVYLYAAIERWAGAQTSDAAGIAAVHAFGLVLAILTSLGLFLLARELLRRELWWLPPALYGIVSTAKCAYDGLAVNGELLMNAPTVFAVLAVLLAGRSRGGRRVALDLAAGALMGLAGLAKWQALAAGLAFPLLVSRGDRSSFLGRLARRGPIWILGLAIPFAAVAWFFESSGMLADAWRWGGLFNLRYISDGPAAFWALKRLGIQLASVVLPSLAFYSAGLYGLAKRIRSDAGDSAGLIAWALVSLLCVGIGGRFFGHYFLQAELPLCLLAAEPFSRMLDRAPRAVAAAVAVPSLAFLLLGFAPEGTRAVFDSGEPDWTHIGQEISDRSSPSDTLFIWGNVPPLYYLSQRRMGTRFSFCNYLTGLSPGTPSEYGSREPASIDGKTDPSSAAAWSLLFGDLDRRRPTMILDTAAAGWKGYGKFPVSRYPAFAKYLAAHYRVDRRIEGSVLYRRID